MARLARVVIPGAPHHVRQRGTRAQDVFLRDGDRERYLEFVAECAKRFGVLIRAWCLMTNHVHFVAEPKTVDGPARCFGSAHNQYSRMVNFRQGWRGFLFQGVIGKCPRNPPTSLLVGLRALALLARRPTPALA